MKLFKATPVNSGYKTLQDDIKKTTNELQIVYNNLENVVEPDLIDYYIYQAKAVSSADGQGGGYVPLPIL
mgnify:CR=1 FL=1